MCFRGAPPTYIPAEARVVRDLVDGTRTVEVSSQWVNDPVAVRYAFTNLPGELNLTNNLGLPAYPFRTDDWDDVF